jgi:two-component system, OmpR family, phosphate regulon sensor histidine kinase PhoR
LKRATLPVLAGLLLGTLFAAVLGRVLDGAITERTHRDLENRLAYLATEFATDFLPAARTHEKVGSVARQSGARVTLVAPDGVVLADSDVTPDRLPFLENHAARPEIVEARQSGVGFDVRSSATIEVPFVYVARRLGPAGAPAGFVRLAISQQVLDAQEAPFRRTILRISIGAGLLVALLFLAVRQRQRGEFRRVRLGIAEAAEGRRPELPGAASEESQEVFGALARFARLVAAERAGSEKARLLARTVFEQVPVGLVVVDEALDLLDANPAAMALFRAPAGAPRRALVDLVRERALLRLFEAGSVATAAAAPAGEIVRIALDGVPERVLEVTVCALPHAVRSGEPAAIGVVRDVTEHERTETMRRRFVSDVSHELRTPVAAIRAAVETLAVEDSLPADLARLLDILKRQSAQLQDLVSDLTDLSQIESGAVTLSPEAVPVRPLLSGVVNDLAAFAEARGVSVTVEAPDGLAVTGDRRRLAQIFRNLVDNAVKFSPAGARVDVFAEALGGESGGESRAVVHVVDRGIGIPQSELGNIFQRFYRVDPSRAKSVPGTGLGLAIVKHLLILHRGSIAVDSEMGRGSRFSVTLPAAASPPAAVQETT